MRVTRRIQILSQEGFTMIVALLVMFVTSMLLVAAFTAANGDLNNSAANVKQSQAYYAALAGVQEFEYQLQNNPDYWETCPTPKGKVPGESSESYEVTVLASETGGESACNASKPFTSIIESKGSLANTFRVKSIGKAGGKERTAIATFQVAGFLDFVYFTQYEVADPESYAGGSKECANYREQREKLGLNCGTIDFGAEDSVAGPMHTDDTAVVCNGVEFGRAGHNPADSVEIDRGVVSGGCGSGSVKYNTASGSYSVGPELEAPPSDGSLATYVESGNELYGRTELELLGSTKKIKVTSWASGTKTTSEMNWPTNGLIYVASNGSGCAYTQYEQTNTDTTATWEKEEHCGSVYVKGTFSESLTIAAANDVIINGNITPVGVSNGSAPTGTATIGLIATRFVRIYHPCSYFGNSSSGPAGGYLKNPWIYAAILSTSHSFLVDNYTCGSAMENLNVYGAIAQKFRGIVGTFSGSRPVSGYSKEYIYDERLATDEPPYFLAPLKAGWRIIRETAAKAG